MVERSLTQSTPNGDEPPQVVLNMAQWNQLEDCSIAFNAAIQCDAHEGGEGAELIKCVYYRLNQVLSDIRSTIQFPELEDD